MTRNEEPLAKPMGVHHIRLTVTDIGRSKSFYRHLIGADPAVDFSQHVSEPGVAEDPERLYGGCVFEIGSQLLGLRPVAPASDRFDSTRVGLDHLSLGVGSTAELHATAGRLTEAGIEHGAVKELTGMGLAILSLQDPDQINLELSAPLAQA